MPPLRLSGFKSITNGIFPTIYSLTVAGVTLPKQQVALATTGYWNGDGISSGILGLGLPALTEAFVGGSPGSDGLQNVVQYNPVVTTMANQTNLPIFSLGLSRKTSESFLAFGGVPENVKVGPYATTPLQKVRVAYSEMTMLRKGERDASCTVEAETNHGRTRWVDDPAVRITSTTP